MNLKFLFSRIIFTFLVTFFLANQLKAQDKKPADEKTKHAIGAGAGFSTGYGLSYRYTPTTLGVQVNFAPYKSETSSQFSIGLTALYSLLQTEKTNLYLYQANHLYSESYLTDNYSTTPYSKTRIENTYFNNGVGFGIEIIIASKVGFNLMTGYAAYNNFKGLNVTGEAALYFKF
jgi:hypothetical protein